MGAYLSEPLTEKHSEDMESTKYRVGACSMQGWRVAQEDDHNAELEYDADSAYFAVYDGHGGAEVAKYCAAKLPAFIQSRKDYDLGAGEEDMKKTLADAFVAFDATLVERPVVAELKRLAGVQELDEEADPEEVSNLYEEATMTLEDVIQKYEDSEEAQLRADAAEVGAGGDGDGDAEKPKPVSAALAKVKAGSSSGKGVSPFLRAKRESRVEKEEVADTEKVDDADAKPIEARKEGKEENGEAQKENASEGNGPNEEDATIEEKKEEAKVNGHDTTPTNGSDGEKAAVTENGVNGEGEEKKETPVASKGKGKGKGKGKSNVIKSSSSASAEEDESEPAAPVQKPKVKKSADELYRSMLDDKSK